MAENELPESAHRADSMPISASERGGEREPLTEAQNGENRAPRRCGAFLGARGLCVLVIDSRGALQVAGIALGFGFPIKLAEVFASERDPVRITDDPRIDDRVFLCMPCFSETDLPLLMEKIHQQRERKRAAGGGAMLVVSDVEP